MTSSDTKHLQVQTKTAGTLKVLALRHDGDARPLCIAFTTHKVAKQEGTHGSQTLAEAARTGLAFT